MNQPTVNNLLPRLQRWYHSQCNGDWEHAWSVKIETPDNPGWSIKVNLAGTAREDREFAPISRGLDVPEPNADWFTCRVEDQTFSGAGGPEYLAEVLAVFLSWAESP